jgi:NADP-dependent 3-hydroxy acid dehydrogenase YdfG
MTQHDSKPLHGRVAVVTGASRGYGFATAEALIERGARVALLARSREPLLEAAARLGDSAIAVPVDIADGSSVRAAFREVDARLRRLDFLINNAGIASVARVENLDDDDLLAMVNTNFVGQVRCTRSAIPLLKRSGGGRIVNVSSDAVRRPLPYLSIYVATKSAVESFSQALRDELRADGIGVTVFRAGSSHETGFASEWSVEETAAAGQLWAAGGYLPYANVSLDAKTIGSAIVNVLLQPDHANVEIVEFRGR